MARVVVAAFAAVLLASPTPAADPTPLWEIDLKVPEKDKGFVRPGWLGVSPDGKAVAAVVVQNLPVPGRCEFTLRVWDAATRKERFAAELAIADFYWQSRPLTAFTPDGGIVTSGSKVVVRSLADGKEMAARDVANSAGVPGVWVGADGKACFHFHTPLPDAPVGRAELFRRPTPTEMPARGPEQVGRVPVVFPDPPSMLSGPVALSPDGSRLAVGFRDGGIFDQTKYALALYAVKSPTEGRLTVEPVAALDRPHPGMVTAVAFSPDGKTLATGGDEGSVRLWDVAKAGEKWKPTATIPLADFRVFAVAFRPDGKTLAAVTYDAKKPNLYLIDVMTAKVVRAVKLEREHESVAWSPDGKVLLTGGYAAKIQAWDADALLKGD